MNKCRDCVETERGTVLCAKHYAEAVLEEEKMQRKHFEQEKKWEDNQRRNRSPYALM